MPEPPPAQRLTADAALLPEAKRHFRRLVRLLRAAQLQRTDVVGIEMMATLLSCYYRQIAANAIDEACKLSREVRQWARLYGMTPSDLASLLVAHVPAEREIEDELVAPSHG